MENRYSALRIIGTIYKILGGVLAVLTLLSILGICATSFLGGAAFESIQQEFGGDISGFGLLGSVVAGIVTILFVLVTSGGLAVTFYAIGEGIFLLIALEENTRETVLFLKRESVPSQQSSPSD